jgi:hypothetical protein
VSATLSVEASSSWSSSRRPRAVRALNRAIDRIQVETCDRFSKVAGLPPHAKEDLADQIFRVASVGYETDDETKNANMVPPVQRPHSGLAPFRNRLDEVFV